MARLELLIDACASETRAVLMDERGPVALRFYEPRAAGDAERGALGAVILARVTRVDARMNAAFLDIGADRDGFLPLKEGAPREDVVEGADVLVQVRRAAEDEKGARLSTDLILTDGAMRLIADGTGAVRRRLTPWGEAMDPAALSEREAALEARGDAISQAAREAKAPARLDPPRDPVAYAVEDLAAPGLAHVRVNAAAAKRAAEEALQGSGATVDVGRTREAVDGAVEGALSPDIAADGAVLFMEATRAFWAVDVDAAKVGAAKGFDVKAAGAANRAAARALARAVRLKEAGGLIVVDLAGAPRAGEAKAVEAAFKKAFKGDPNPCRFGAVTPFGLFEIARRKDGPSVAARLLAADGAPRPETLGARALRALEDALAHEPTSRLHLQLRESVLVSSSAKDRLAARTGGRFTIEVGEAPGGAPYLITPLP